MKQLLLGAGSSHVRHLPFGETDEFDDLVTLDNNKHHHPDVLWDLEDPYLPFESDTFDEIHAYEVLEHTGAQGDAYFFFDQWNEFWRMLKPGGMFYGSVPWWKDNPWVWGDPSHKRCIPPETFVFLDQTEYTKQVGVTPMSDFRHLYYGDFDVVELEHAHDRLWFSLRAVKPSRLE